MRKIIVYIATSADGFIARKDGAVDWLDRPRIKGDYGMGKFFKSIDTILWGRKTYDMVLRFQKEGKDAPDMSGIKNYAFSRHPPRKVARRCLANFLIGSFTNSKPRATFRGGCREKA